MANSPSWLLAEVLPQKAIALQDDIAVSAVALIFMDKSFPVRSLGTPSIMNGIYGMDYRRHAEACWLSGKPVAGQT